MLDRQIRSVIEYEYIHRKVGNFGIKGKVYLLLWGSKVHVAVKVWYPMQEKVSSEVFQGAEKSIIPSTIPWRVRETMKEPPGARGPRRLLHCAAWSAIMIVPSILIALP